MSPYQSNSNTFALASRFLHAFQQLSRLLNATSLNASSFERLNMAQLRILQVVHEEPGIHADVVLSRLELELETGKQLILAMEKSGLLAVERAIPSEPPGLRLGAQGQRLAYQVQATQLVAVVDLLDKLSEDERRAVVEVLERVVPAD